MILNMFIAIYGKNYSSLELITNFLYDIYKECKKMPIIT